MRGEADGERELSLLALSPLQLGSAATAQAPNRFPLVRARHRHQALGESAVQVPATRLPLRARLDPTVAFRKRALQPIALYQSLRGC